MKTRLVWHTADIKRTAAALAAYTVIACGVGAVVYGYLGLMYVIGMMVIR